MDREKLEQLAADGAPGGIGGGAATFTGVLAAERMRCVGAWEQLAQSFEASGQTVAAAAMRRKVASLREALK